MSDLLLISPTPTHPTTAGNRARIRTWIELLEQAGVDFHFIFFRSEPGDETAMARRWTEARCSFVDFVPPVRKYPLARRIQARWGARVRSGNVHKVIRRELRAYCVTPALARDWK